jgi:hypothetical protein
MHQITIADLISKTEQELLKLRYSDVSMKYYRRMFGKIADFFVAHNEICFRENVAMKWLDEVCDFSNKEKRKELSEADVYLFRVVKTLANVANGEKIPTKCQRKVPEFTDEMLMSTLNRLSEFSKSHKYAQTTQGLHRKTAAALFKFMLERNLYPKDINPQIISEYIRTCEGYSKKTMESKMYALRIITQFLYDEGIAAQNCSPLLPKVNAPRFTTLPSV